jgi:glycosyltransferase involved in cell wall biosynthesis
VLAFDWRVYRTEDVITVEDKMNRPNTQLSTPDYPPIRIAFLVQDLTAPTDNTFAILSQANALIARGHSVTIVTYSDPPAWFNVRAKVIKVPEGDQTFSFVPQCEVAISTYLLSAEELSNVDAKLKMYFIQSEFEESSQAYLFEGIKLVVNSEVLKQNIEKRYGKKADAVLSIGVDSKIFHPIQKSISGSKLRILVVGSDVKGNEKESPRFNSITVVKEALSEFAGFNNNFTVVRISDTQLEIFKDFPCEFYVQPNDEMKAFLYGTADVVIDPAQNESWRLTPLQAMASGTAVICTDNPCANEYCKDGENCIRIPMNSSIEIVNALQRIFLDNDFKSKLEKGGLATTQVYTKENEYSSLERLLFQFIEEQGVMDLNKYRREIQIEKEKSELSKQFVIAQQLINKEKYTDALTLLSLLDTLENPQEELHELLSAGFSMKGLCCKMLSAMNKAIQNYEKAIMLNSKSVTAHLGLGMTYTTMNQHKNAKSKYEQVITLDKKNLPARQGLAAANRKIGLESSDNALLGEGVLTLLSFAEAHINVEAIGEARKTLYKILVKDPLHIDALNDLSVCDIIEQKTDIALEKISKVLEIDPENETALTNFNFIKGRVSSPSK